MANRLGRRTATMRRHSRRSRSLPNLLTQKCSAMPETQPGDTNRDYVLIH